MSEYLQITLKINLSKATTKAKQQSNYPNDQSDKKNWH